MKAWKALFTATVGMVFLFPCFSRHAVAGQAQGDHPDYLDRTLPVENRVKDLLDRMTLQEKVNQLCFGVVDQPLSEIATENTGVQDLETLKKIIAEQGIGHLAGTLRTYPLEEGIAIANDLQRTAMDESRLGIPLIVHDECAHGCLAAGSTSFPVSIAMAGTWNPELVKKAAEAIGKETRTRGINQALSPTINIARDPRCGRTQETYGEDPYLGTSMAVAFIKGLQSQGVAATPKHFIANFAGPGGRDSQAVDTSERLLREIFLPVYQAAIQEAGAWSIMAAYNSLNGIPCHCNSRLLRNILKQDWGFQGFVISDYTGVIGLHTRHGVAKNPSFAARIAIMAGVDVDAPNAACFKHLPELVEQGVVPLKTLDDAVSRVLYVKFQLGLFENPFADPKEAAETVGCDAHKALALEAARQSMVLLKNEGDLLPLQKDLGSIAVIGPNAAEARLGGYSVGGCKGISPLEGIRETVSRETRVEFAKGCDVAHIIPPDREKRLHAMISPPHGEAVDFSEAIRIASAADCVILCMGNSRETEGEARDRSNLDLPGVQEALIREVCKVNDRVSVVLIGGSAVTMTSWIDEAEAVIEAWYPGQEGGRAVAETLFGEINPGGKLPLTFPYHTGQLPLYYNQYPSGRLYDYMDVRGEQARFPFGF
ncbi:MAG: glycoside hydrolase family 3 C-terminal domain-containing protein, partial [Planctomycetes bacterium]|nr:glycoside hydrolase family 3 C-terminal domain-containing protein [Planctomycetota bacterium]